MPIIGGLYGFKSEDLNKCKKDFEYSTPDIFFEYYTEKKVISK
jgi:hypothetical protein